MKPVDAPLRRSVLITPGSRPERVARAAATPCDSVVIVEGVFLALDTVHPLRRVLWMAERLGIGEAHLAQGSY